jgi:hypothetical protein
MWDKLNKVQGAIALAVAGSSIVLLFMMAMAIMAAVHGKWDMADKWATMLFMQSIGAFFGFLYMKSQQTAKTTQP